MENNWFHEFPGAITVCDCDGIILEMNARSQNMFREDGGESLIGSNLLNCHPEPSRSKVHEMLATGQCNAYTIEKKGVHKLIYQSPWYKDGVYAGLVEISLELPESLLHFVRQG